MSDASEGTRNEIKKLLKKFGTLHLQAKKTGENIKKSAREMRDKNQEKIDKLGQEIQKKGVGFDPDLENNYLLALKERHRLTQIDGLEKEY